ncbi:MAG: cytochrome c [Gemmatimonadetes bacterium]|nr:cytochrome c [Gemmatimonadota bacterium]
MRAARKRFAGGAWALLAVLLAACAPDTGREPEVTAAASGSVAQAAFSGSLPAHAPERFGFGAPASADRIALWDIDIKPDGEGLPPGSGSVAEGRRIYELSCMQCHGPTGTEGPNDRLASSGEWGEWPAGRTVGGYWPYATTLFDYTRKAMPQATPGTLGDDEVYAVVGYVLHLSGLVPADAVMDAETLAAVEMPYRDRFVPDDRKGGPEIR